jgi:hypothetical protein
MVFHSRSGIWAFNEVVEADLDDEDGAKAMAEPATLAKTAAEMVFMVSIAVNLPVIAEEIADKARGRCSRAAKKTRRDP